MKQEIIIRMQPDSDKCKNKALKVAAAVSGVESITLTGRDKDLLLVIGSGVDATKLIKKLKKEVGEAEIVELRTLDAGSAALPRPSTSTGGGGAQASPYRSHPTPGRSLPGGGRIMYPVSAPPALANPGRARWPSEHRQAEAGYYRRVSSLSYYYASPVAGHGEYGSSYARAVARSHPANYSPMIKRHDNLAAGRSRWAGKPRHGGGGEEPNCCSIL